MRAIVGLLVGQRDLRLVLSAGLVSMVGDWILRIGLTYHVFVLTNSTVVSAILMLSSFVPQLLLGSVAGVFVDRWDRRRTMVVTNLLLAVGLLPLLLVHDAGRVWIVFVVVFVEAAVAQFFIPAEQALLPRLVPDDRLVTANALNGQTRDLSRLVGSAVGGVVAAAGGLVAVTLVDAASFLICAALITALRTSGRVDVPAGQVLAGAGEQPTTAAAHRLAVLRDEWVDGLRLVARHPVLRLLAIFLLTTSTGEGIMSTLFAPFVRQVLHGSNEAFGIVVAVQAIGGIVGGLFAAAIGHRVSPARLLGVGAVVFGAIDLAIFLYPLGYVAVWPAVIGMVAVGLPGALALAGFMTLFQRTTVDSHRGRVFGSLGAAEGVAVMVGTLGAGLLAQFVGIIPVLAVQGASYMVAGFVMLVTLPAASRQQEAAETRTNGPNAMVMSASRTNPRVAAIRCHCLPDGHRHRVEPVMSARLLP
jgi:Na+/melibiose symporter-like transporter